MKKKLISQIKNHFSIEHCVIRFLMAWCFISLLQTSYIKLKKLCNIQSINFIGRTNFVVTITALVIAFLLLYLYFEVIHSTRIEKISFLIITFLYALLCVYLYQNLYFCIGVVALMAMSVCYCFTGVDTAAISVNRRLVWALTILSGIFFVAFTGGCFVYKYLTYSSPNFDLGLFSQMFHYMKTTLTMNTTCERDQLLSHLCVHVSPVFYLLLPFYALYSSAATLQVMQAVVIALGLIPLYMICKHHELSGLEIIAVMSAYCLYPVLSGGCSYDFHENFFLCPFLLCLLCFMEKDSWKGIIISMLLVFSIKEDAAIYVAFIALYMLFGKKMWKKGSVVLVSSIVYFIFTTVLLANIGEGAMVYRFDNMIYGESGSMLGIIRTVLTNPAYLVIQIFQEDKLEFLLQVMAPLLFLPCCSKKWPRFILFGPFILFNMMSDYQYFHSIYFQYVFGSATLLIYLTVINVADMNRNIRSRMIILLPISCCLFFVSLMWNKTDYISDYYTSRNQKIYQEFEDAFALIPDDASVTATTFLCPALSDRDVLYELYYTDETTEYVVLDLRVATTDYNVSTYLDSDDYETVYYSEGKIAVFRNLSLRNDDK